MTVSEHNQSAGDCPQLAKQLPITVPRLAIPVILSGARQVLRVPVAPQPEPGGNGQQDWVWRRTRREDAGMFRGSTDALRLKLLEQCPFGAVGTRLWVREPFWQASSMAPDPTLDVLYDATMTLGRRPGGEQRVADAEHLARLRLEVVNGEDQLRHRLSNELGWRRYSPTVMPRWASRVELTMSSITTHRLHQIDGPEIESDCLYPLARGPLTREAYAFCWERAYGVHSWARNDWVYRIAFTVLVPPLP